MRFLMLAIVGLVLAAVTVQASPADGPYVASVVHQPPEREPGQDLEIVATLTDNGTEIVEILVSHCRVDPSYACALDTTPLVRQADGTWTGTIAWDEKFLTRTSWAGYQLNMKMADGNESVAPVTSVGAPPPELYAEETAYYFYRVAEKTGGDSPGVAWTIALPILAVAVFLRRRRVP